MRGELEVHVNANEERDGEPTKFHGPYSRVCRVGAGEDQCETVLSVGTNTCVVSRPESPSFCHGLGHR